MRSKLYLFVLAAGLGAVAAVSIAATPAGASSAGGTKQVPIA